MSETKEKPLFDVCLITRNEEKVIGRLLQSLIPFKEVGGRVFVLDTGSTDATEYIASNWGATVTQVGEKFLHTIDEDFAEKMNEKFVVEGDSKIINGGDKYFDFASARNASAEVAEQDWICYADADEVFTKLDVPYINSVIRGDSNLENLEYEFIFAHKPDGSPALQFRQSKFYNKKKMKWTHLTHEVLCNI